MKKYFITTLVIALSFMFLSLEDVKADTASDYNLCTTEYYNFYSTYYGYRCLATLEWNSLADTNNNGEDGVYVYIPQTSYWSDVGNIEQQVGFSYSNGSTDDFEIYDQLYKFQSFGNWVHIPFSYLVNFNNDLSFTASIKITTSTSSSAPSGLTEYITDNMYMVYAKDFDYIDFATQTESEIWNDGYNIGYIEGEAVGYNEGYNSAGDFDPMAWLKSFVFFIGFLFNVEFVQGISVGTIAMFWIILTVVPAILGLITLSRR